MKILGVAMKLGRLNRRRSYMAVILASAALIAGLTGAAMTKQEQSPPARMIITAMDFEWDNVPEEGAGIEMINERFQIDYRPKFYLVNDYRDKLVSTMNSGHIPDIVAFPSRDTSQFIQYARQGLFLPIDPYMDRNDYPTFNDVPEETRANFTVNGSLFGLPQYYPRYNLTPIIRKDWLDKLGLKMPASLEELKKTAIAFAKDDPDGNGKDDTYGIVTGYGYYPEYSFGAYWDSGAWLHKNEQGDYIPGSISPAFRDQIAMMAELYKEGALSENFALMTWNQLNQEFYHGKGGIFVGAPNGMIQNNMKELILTDPGAEIVPIPPFKDPNGGSGYLNSVGYVGITALSARLADQPEKLARILDMLDFGRTYYPVDEQTPDNKNYDWYMGYVGKGYDFIGGKIRAKSNFFSQGLAPVTYFVDSFEWIPESVDQEYHQLYTYPQTAELSRKLERMWAASSGYTSPIIGLYSETLTEKGEALDNELRNEQIKMIAGVKPLSEWDDMVNRYLEQGGNQIIKELNEGIRERNG